MIIGKFFFGKLQYVFMFCLFIFLLLQMKGLLFIFCLGLCLCRGVEFFDSFLGSCDFMGRWVFIVLRLGSSCLKVIFFGFRVLMYRQFRFFEGRREGIWLVVYVVDLFCYFSLCLVFIFCIGVLNGLVLFYFYVQYILFFFYCYCWFYS